MENLLGSFEARRPSMWSADVLYAVSVTDERLVALRIGGQFSGVQANALAVQFGLLGGLVLGWLRRREERRRAAAPTTNPQTLDEQLRGHRSNFAVTWHELKRASITRRSAWQRMAWPGEALLTLERQSGAPVKLIVQERAQLERCLELMQASGGAVLRIDPNLGISPTNERSRLTRDAAS